MKTRFSIKNEVELRGDIYYLEKRKQTLEKRINKLKRLLKTNTGG